MFYISAIMQLHGPDPRLVSLRLEVSFLKTPLVIAVSSAANAYKGRSQECERNSCPNHGGDCGNVIRSLLCNQATESSEELSALMTHPTMTREYQWGERAMLNLNDSLIVISSFLSLVV